MIAYDSTLVDCPRPRVGSRAGRTAAEVRRARTAKLRRRATAAIMTVLIPATILIVAYVALMANLTRLGYEIGKLEARRVVLLEKTARLDDRIAQLESRDRLARMMAPLGLRPAETLTVAVLPPPKSAEPARGLAFLPIAA